MSSSFNPENKSNSLEVIESQLDNELERVSRLQTEFNAWAENKRNEFEEKKRHLLRSGQCPVSIFNELISILQDSISKGTDNTNLEYALSILHDLGCIS